MRLYAPQQLQAAFKSMTIAFTGDSTLHEVRRPARRRDQAQGGVACLTLPRALPQNMAGLMAIFGAPYDMVDFSHIPPGLSNRIYDSRDQFPVRFSWDWLGAASVSVQSPSRGRAGGSEPY